MYCGVICRNTELVEYSELHRLLQKTAQERGTYAAEDIFKQNFLVH